MTLQAPREATPIAINRDFATLFIFSFENVYGREPTREEAEWLTALFSQETAGGKRVIQHNWGNLAAPNMRSGEYWVPRWADDSITDNELSKAELATRQRLEKGEAVPRAFKAFASHEQGARNFLHLFTRPTHTRILDAANRDDAIAFWRAVSTPHPKTKMMYCVECHTEEHRKAYLAEKNRIHDMGIFDRLTPSPKGEAPPAAPVSLSV